MLFLDWSVKPGMGNGKKNSMTVVVVHRIGNGGSE